MGTVGIRALKQNASAVVAAAAAGETVTITDRGRPVAQLAAVPDSTLDRLIASGQASPPRRSMQDLAPAPPGPSLSDELRRMRAAEDR